MSDLGDDPYVVAQALGVVVILPQEDELLIDIDNEADLSHFYKMQTMLFELAYPIEITKLLRGKRNDHCHLYVRFPRPVKAEERIALQACLGSDRHRELLSFLRIEFDLKRPPTVFFERTE